MTKPLNPEKSLHKIYQDHSKIAEGLIIGYPRWYTRHLVGIGYDSERPHIVDDDLSIIYDYY